jgi:hypothetical protein
MAAVFSAAAAGGPEGKVVCTFGGVDLSTGTEREGGCAATSVHRSFFLPPVGRARSKTQRNRAAARNTQHSLTHSLARSVTLTLRYPFRSIHRLPRRSSPLFAHLCAALLRYLFINLI